MKLAELGCSSGTMVDVLWRQISDFDYYVFDLRSQYPNEIVYKQNYLHYLFSKTVEADDEYERTSSVKIGDCVSDTHSIK